MAFNVRSEVGRLRQVIVHRPGLELSRLTPRNIGELLFDDLDGPALAQLLVGGVLKADLHPGRLRSLRWNMLRADDFLLRCTPVRPAR